MKEYFFAAIALAAILWGGAASAQVSKVSADAEGIT